VIHLATFSSSTLLEACILQTLVKKDAYGYALSQEIENVMSISESTLYPVLRRLQKDGFLQTYDQPYNGRNRRYYKITQKGNDVLALHKKSWEAYKQKLDQILGGISNDKK
jgi:PadR family transcriptional regulator PadR